jgi:hypothetical protein
MSKVFHATKPTFGFGDTPKWPEEYQLVAELETESLEKAFELTNHISCAWWDNEGVKLVKQSRSTSVGDIVITNEGTFLCDRVGWTKLY